MTLLKFTQEMYLLVNVKPLDDLKVQNLWINVSYVVEYIYKGFVVGEVVGRV